MKSNIPKAITNKPGKVVSIWNFVDPASAPMSLKLEFCVSVPLPFNIWSPIRVMPVRMIRTPIRVTIEPLLLVKTLHLLRISGSIEHSKSLLDMHSIPCSPVNPRAIALDYGHSARHHYPSSALRTFPLYTFQ